jgi:hypothetical protein
MIAWLAQSTTGGGWSYRPFLDPLDLHATWWLTAIPLVVLMSIAYKACRVGDLGQYWKQVATMSVQLVLLLIGIAIATHALVEWVIPFLETV